MGDGRCNRRIESDRGTAYAAKELGATVVMDAPSPSRLRGDMTVVESVVVDMVMIVGVGVGTQQWIQLLGTQPTRNQLRKRMSAVDTVVM